MYVLYSFLLAAGLAIVLPVYFVRLRLSRGKPLGLAQRLGLALPRPVPCRSAIWLHAVSVGEVLSLQHLVRELKTRHPDWAVYFSVLTQAGMEVARRKISFADRLFYVPFDFGWAVRRFLARLRPDLLVLAESELWPNLLRFSRRMTGGVLVVNGRVSERSYRRYRRLRALAVRLFEDISLYLVQTERDGERLVRAGMRPNRVQVAGNLKCEVVPSAVAPAEVAAFRVSLGLSPSDKVLVAGSTRRGEERRLLRAFIEARNDGADIRLILAPRHMDRVPEVERICRESALRACLRTRAQPGRAWDVLILDTVGELSRIYALGQAAFIGGSLVPWGGHNLLEPAALAKPVFFGPHMHNFSALAEAFLAGGAAGLVRNEVELRTMFRLEDTGGLEEMGRRASRVLQGLQGATARSLEAIEKLIFDAKTKGRR